MEFKGTKGKWTTFYDDWDGYGVRLVEDGFSFGRVEICSNLRQGDTDGLADAKLISKAPEMLEMLIKINEGIHTMDFTQLEILQPEIEQLIQEATEI